MTASLDPKWRKPLITGENQAQQEETSFDLECLDQRQLAAFDLSRCLNEAMRHDPRTDQQIAKAIGASKGYMSKWLTSVGAEQLGRLARFCLTTGHVGPVQKLAYELGFDLKPKRPRRRAIARARAAATND